MESRLVDMLKRIPVGSGICTLILGNPTPTVVPHRSNFTSSVSSTHSLMAVLLTETMYRLVMVLERVKEATWLSLDPEFVITRLGVFFV